MILSLHRRLCPENSVSPQRRLRFEETGSAAATFWSLRDPINARGARDLLGHTFCHDGSALYHGSVAACGPGTCPLAGFVRAFCLCRPSIGFQRPFRRLCLCPAKSRFPLVESGFGGNSVRMLRQCDGRPSISCCLDHSAGKSVRRAMPMPCGSRPSMAALTRSGARKASEIVMFTLRMLQVSRLAMVSVVADGSVVSSSSQRRPRATAATTSRAFPNGSAERAAAASPWAERISRRRVDVAR